METRAWGVEASDSATFSFSFLFSQPQAPRGRSSDLARNALRTSPRLAGSDSHSFHFFKPSIQQQQASVFGTLQLSEWRRMCLKLECRSSSR